MIHDLEYLSALTYTGKGDEGEAQKKKNICLTTPEGKMSQNKHHTLFCAIEGELTKNEDCNKLASEKSSFFHFFFFILPRKIMFLQKRKTRGNRIEKLWNMNVEEPRQIFGWRKC